MKQQTDPWGNTCADMGAPFKPTAEQFAALRKRHCPYCGNAVLDLRITGFDDEPAQEPHVMVSLECFACGVSGPGECSCIADRAGVPRLSRALERWDAFFDAWGDSARPKREVDHV